MNTENILSNAQKICCPHYKVIAFPRFLYYCNPSERNDCNIHNSDLGNIYSLYRQEYQIKSCSRIWYKFWGSNLINFHQKPTRFSCFFGSFPSVFHYKFRYTFSYIEITQITRIVLNVILSISIKTPIT